MSARELTEMILGHDTPLRLDAAAKIAFPDGSMKESGLRREAKRGRLVIARIADKDFTTLNHIKRMVELCHVSRPRRDSGNEKNVVTSPGRSLTLPPGLSSMAVARSALDSTLQTLSAHKKPLPITSMESIPSRSKRMGARYAVEWLGRPIQRIDESFRFLVEEVGLEGQVIPRTLRHTCATWLMQAGADPWEVAGFLGMRTYGHHHPNHVAGVHAAFQRHRTANVSPTIAVNRR
jgi:hypothetical protein